MGLTMHDRRRSSAAALLSLFVASGCSLTTDFDRFHGREDAGTERDAATADAGSDSGGCTATTDPCNGEDDDCDGTTDEDWDCPEVEHSAPSCTDGACTPLCEGGFADCDGVYDNGCEVDLTSPEDCGACGASCEGGSFCASEGCVAECPGGTMGCGRSCVDTSESVLHCGGCGEVCPTAAHSSPTCASGECGFACDDGWADCDGGTNGCETELGTVADCGGCGDVCSYPNGIPACAEGSCELSECTGGFADCDSDASTGCEADLSTAATCGDCATSCEDRARAVASCGAGGCEWACDDGWADCNGVGSDGCEASLADPSTCGDCSTTCPTELPVCSGGSCVTGCSGATPDLCGGSCVDIDSDPNNCGSCGRACDDPPHASPTCSSGTCGMACDDGYGECNGLPSDGCETNLRTASHCGACGSMCSLPHASATCPAGACLVSSCDTSWADCNGSPSDGCEIDLNSVDNCGGCGNVCSVSHGTPGCASETCVVEACDPGWGDCDYDYTTGCEAALVTYYRDMDGDGYGVDATTRPECPGWTVSGWADRDGDCDDSAFDVHPGATEACNRSDDDCDGFVDENVLAAEPAFSVYSGMMPQAVRVAWSPSLGQAAAIFWDWDAGGTKTLYLARAYPDGTAIGTTIELDSGANFYHPDVTAASGGWAVVFTRNEPTGGRDFGQFAMVSASGAVTWGSFPGPMTGTAGPSLPRIAYATGTDTVMIAWVEDRSGTANPDYVRFASYDSGTLFTSGQIDQHDSNDLTWPAITHLSSREFAVAWGSIDSLSGDGHSRYRRVDATFGTVGAIFSRDADAAVERDHEIAFAGPLDRIITAFMDGAPSLPHIAWSHISSNLLDYSGKLGLPSGATRALPGWAGDGAYTIAFGSTDTAGTLRRFRPSDNAPVPGDVPLGIGQVGDMASMTSGDYRHVLAFPRSNDVQLRFIGCM